MRTDYLKAALTVGCVSAIAPRLLNQLFPLRPDNWLGALVRSRLRQKYETYLATCGEKTQRVFRVVLPDNLEIAAFMVSYYCLPDLCAHPKLDPERVSVLIGFYLSTLGVCHMVRELLFLTAPVVNNFPWIGPSLCQLFRTLGPNDLRSRRV